MLHYHAKCLVHTFFRILEGFCETEMDNCRARMNVFLNLLVVSYGLKLNLPCFICFILLSY
jgi:hypothetical protein